MCELLKSYDQLSHYPYNRKIIKYKYQQKYYLKNYKNNY